MNRNTLSPILFPLFILSGATGLVYELVWTRELIFVFGGTTHAISTVLVAFMGGLGLGSFIAGRLSRNINNPALVYGLIEILIGAYALVVPSLLHLAEPLYKAVYPLVVSQPWLLTAVRFVVGALILMIPTTLMGATLPILVRHAARVAGDAARWVGVLYGINTLGAVLGTLATGFALIPMLGLLNTTRAAATINIAIGLIAILAFRGRSVAQEPSEPLSGTRQPRASTPPLPAKLLRAIAMAFALSGFASMVYQIAWTRALILSLGSSTYALTCILAAFILGLALGSLAIARWVDRLRNPARAIGVILLAIGATAVCIQPLFDRVPFFVHALVAGYNQHFDTLLRIQFLMVTLITIVPTLLMGMLFPLITRVLSQHDHDPAAAAGRAYAINTLGTILGSFLAGFVLIRGDVLGAQYSIIFAALLNAIVGAALIRMSLPAEVASDRARLAALLAVLAVAGVGGLAGEWDRAHLNSAPFRMSSNDPATYKANQTLLWVADGVDMTVAVTHATSDPTLLSLTVNGKPDASTHVKDMTTQLLQGHMPTLLARDPRRVCVIGLGSGMTLAAVARHETVQHIDCAEISEEVIKANRYFAPYCYDVLDDPRVRMIRNDGRNHLLLSDTQYDVIISEPSNPWIAGVANLFTREFFELCERRLAPGGVFCLWVQGYTLSLENFRLIARTLADRFPYVSIWDTSTNDYAMIAAREPMQIPLDTLLARLKREPVRLDLYRIGHGDLHAPLGRFLAGGAAVRAWTGTGLLHTDDNAQIEFSAPRQLYANDELEILRELLSIVQSPFDDIAALTRDDPRHIEFQRRVAAAFEARRLRFVSDDRRRLQEPPGAVINPILEALRIDPGNFEAYQRLVDADIGIHKYFTAFVESSEGKQVIERMHNARSPAITPTTGSDRYLVLDLLVALARIATNASQPAVAADYLREAYSVDPCAPAVVIAYARALYFNGDAASAHRILSDALRDGAISPAELKNPDIAILRDVPDFHALFEPENKP